MILDFENKWRVGQSITVGFTNGNQELHDKVIETVRIWENYANIKFDFETSDSVPNLRVHFEDVMNDSKIGADSVTYPEEEPTIRFLSLNSSSSEEDFGKYALHEFGHALGLIHEHFHPEVSINWDKKKLSDYYMRNFNYTKRECENNLFRPYLRNQLQFSGFDPASLMMYPIPGSCTFDGIEYSQGSQLTDIDKEFIASIYTEKEPEILELKPEIEIKGQLKHKWQEDYYSFKIVSDEPKYCIIQSQCATKLIMCLYCVETEHPRNGMIKYISPFYEGEGLGEDAKLSKDFASGEYFVRVRHFESGGTDDYKISLKIL
jgi:hypothetical protein